MDVSYGSFETECDFQPISLEEMLLQIENIENLPRRLQGHTNNELNLIRDRIEAVNASLDIENDRCLKLKEQRRREIAILSQASQEAIEGLIKNKEKISQRTLPNNEGILDNCLLF